MLVPSGRALANGNAVGKFTAALKPVDEAPAKLRSLNYLLNSQESNRSCVFKFCHSPKARELGSLDISEPFVSVNGALWITREARKA